MTDIAIVHDQLLQRGGAERVVLALADAFPGASVVTSIFDPERTFDGFGALPVDAIARDRLGLFRGDFRRSLPLLAPIFASRRVDADVVLCSSAGWAHGVRATGRKVVYCHTPPRWLHNFTELRSDLGPASRRTAHLVAPAFRRWDGRAAHTADGYIANSHAVRRRIADVYGIDATVVYPSVTRFGEPAQPEGLRADHDFVLTVARLQGYKNVREVLAVADTMSHLRFVVVGAGGALDALRRAAPPNVELLGSVADDELAWLYEHCGLLFAPAFEDFGLTPIEAASFGKPTVALGWGGHLETVRDRRTGVLTRSLETAELSAALAECVATEWDRHEIRALADQFSHERFVREMRDIVADYA